MTTTPDYAGLIERLRSHEERWECAGGGGWETPEVCIQAAAAISALQGEVQELNKLLADGANGRTLAAEAQLGELLAIIHRDGGQYQEAHGNKKAVDDAHLIWADLVRRAEAADAEVARLKDELDQAVGVIEPFASFFNKVLEGFTPDYLKRRDPESVAFGWNEGHLYLKDFIRARSFRDGQKTGGA